MRVSHLTVLAAAVLAHAPAGAEGYHDWRFGMSKAEVSAVGDPSRYYSFKNGDLGAQGEPFEGKQVPISFYFANEKLNRVMLIAYTGSETAKAQEAWQAAYTHLARQCGGVEVPSFSHAPAPLDAALTVFDVETAKLKPGQRHFLGCLQPPARLRLWASATRMENGALMVAVNYGRP